MTPLHLSATTIVSALGRGSEATLQALRERRGGLTPCDFPGAPERGFIGRVQGLDEWQISGSAFEFSCRNNALADMALRDGNFMDRVANARARYGAGRIATVIGTSTSGILSAEEAYRRRDPVNGDLPDDFNYAGSYDLFSLSRFVRDALGLHGPATTVSTACASSARAFIDAHHLIASGQADAAIVGGADSLCRLTLSGFASLDLVSDEPCKPCDATRKGISIGEAAGFALLEPAGSANTGAVALLGYGASCDGYHMSSPQPDGAGAAIAMRAALQNARLQPSDISYINLHGTGTRANDAMEDRATGAVFGVVIPCSSTKGYTGHTMGSCGIVEAIIAKLCIENDFLPGCLGVSEVDPAFTINVAVGNQDSHVRNVVSNAFGFGGVNCSLVFGTA